MASKRASKRKIVLLVIAAFIFAIIELPSLRSFADTVSSADFMAKDTSIGPFGGYSSSTSFQVVTGGSSIINGNATSTSFISGTGPVNINDFLPKSQTWRWFADANDETPTSSLAAENVAPSGVANAQVIKLRLTIKETSGVTGSAQLKFRLQFAQSSDFSLSQGFVAEAGNCTATSSWCYATSTGGNDNAVISTKVLSDANLCSGGIGNGCGTHNTSGISASTSTQPAGATMEYEFTIMASGAAPGNTYFFRAINTADGSAVPTNGTSSYPSLVTQGAILTFSVAGLPQGTSTNGIVTNVSTTPAGVSFGTLIIASSVTAAQRLSVSTNATNGYELYALQDAPLTDAHGDNVPGVAGTNSSPLPWTSACSSSSSGCYGYHPGSPVLAGGSTRFAPDDSYAALTSQAAEVGFGAFPTTGSTMDIVYRLQIAGTQGNGSYQNNIIYVAAPSF